MSDTPSIPEAKVVADDGTGDLPPVKAVHTPYISADQTLPEITPASVILGCVLAIILGGANMYLGLFAGLTVSASIPAAVISMAALRFLGGNILQNNVVQTAAASGEGLAAGVIFTLPGLVLLGAWSNFHYLETLLLAGLGGILGVLFTIPLRRALIVDQPLQFPEGVATAEVLKVGAEGKAGIAVLALGSIIGAVFKFAASGARLFSESAAYAFQGGGSVFYAGTSLSPALVGVGYIVGLNIAVLVFLGGAANWLIAIPIDALIHGMPEGSAIDAANAIWSARTRFLGVGAMLVGGVWALIQLGPSLYAGIKASLRAYRESKTRIGAVPRTERDFPMHWVLLLSVVSIIPLYFVFQRFTNSLGIAAVMAVLVVIAGFLFSAVSSYMAGLVGSSNNPVSGITIATILCSALLLKLFGIDSKLGPAAAILIGSVVCCAAAIGGDNMQDLKAGHIVGSTPSKQQFMQTLGVVAAVFFMAPLLNILHGAYTIGSPALPAPQARMMETIAAGVFSGQLPWRIIGVGALIAVCVIAFDLYLQSRKAKFRTPVMAFAVGIYLPFELSVPIFLGGLVAHFAERRLKGMATSEEGHTTAARNGMLFSAGLITGEALLGIILAIPIAIAHDAEVMSFGVTPLALPGLILLGAVMYLLRRAALDTRG